MPAVERDLIAAGMPVESADRDVLTAIVTLADTEQSLARLADCIDASIDRHRGDPRPPEEPAAYCVEPVVIVPRARPSSQPPSRSRPMTGGRVSAELIAPYPPGIPVLAPGEEVTPAVLEALVRARTAGIRIAYAADPSLSTIRVADLTRASLRSSLSVYPTSP